MGLEQNRNYALDDVMCLVDQDATMPPSSVSTCIISFFNSTQLRKVTVNIPTTSIYKN